VQCAQHFCMYPVGGWLRAPVLNCLLDARSKMTNVATVASGSPFIQPKNESMGLKELIKEFAVLSKHRKRN